MSENLHPPANFHYEQSCHISLNIHQTCVNITTFCQHQVYHCHRIKHNAALSQAIWKKMSQQLTLTLVKPTIVASWLLSGPLDNHPFLTMVIWRDRKALSYKNYTVDAFRKKIQPTW